MSTLEGALPNTEAVISVLLCFVNLPVRQVFLIDMAYKQM
jgi:hypothetical protein